LVLCGDQKRPGIGIPRWTSNIGYVLYMSHEPAFAAVAAAANAAAIAADSPPFHCIAIIQCMEKGGDSVGAARFGATITIADSRGGLTGSGTLLCTQ